MFGTIESNPMSKDRKSPTIKAKIKKYKEIDPTFQSDFFDVDLNDFAELLKIEFLGLDKPFERYCEERGRSWYWKHWNYDGHRAVSGELSAKLKSIL